MLILAALQAFILVLILSAVTFAPGFAGSIFHDRPPVRAALVAFSAFIAYELFAATLLTVFLRCRRDFPVFGRYVNVLVETSFPDVAALSPRRISLRSSDFRNVARVAVFSLIILSTLRLNFALSAFIGAVAVVELFALASVTLYLIISA
jgi:adenylate cyclase